MYENALIRHKAITLKAPTMQRCIRMFFVILLLVTFVAVYLLVLKSSVHTTGSVRQYLRKLNGFTSIASSQKSASSLQLVRADSSTTPNSTPNSSTKRTKSVTKLVLAASSTTPNSTPNSSIQRSKLVTKPLQSQLFYYDYSEFKFLRLPVFQNTTKCPKANVHFIIRTHPKAFDARQFVRGSWGQTLKNHLIFVLGTEKPGEVSNATQHEYDRYHDLLIVDMIDSYFNLTIKVLTTFHWAKTYCKEPVVIYVGDPDAAVFPKAMNKFVEKIDAAIPQVIGQCHVNAKPFRNPLNKWFASEEVYKPDYYPTYLNGGGIMFLSSAIPIILNATRIDEPYFSIDDAFISGVLAERANVPRICLKSVFFRYPHLNNCWLSPPLVVLGAGGPDGVTGVIAEVNTGMATCNKTDHLQ